MSSSTVAGKVELLMYSQLPISLDLVTTSFHSTYARALGFPGMLTNVIHCTKQIKSETHQPLQNLVEF